MAAALIGKETPIQDWLKSSTVSGTFLMPESVAHYKTVGDFPVDQVLSAISWNTKSRDGAAFRAAIWRFHELHGKPRTEEFQDKLAMLGL